MSITLNNTAAGGSVNITLTWVIGYIQLGINKFAVKDVPGKKTPTVDTDTFTTRPYGYRIRARITDAEKATLITLRNEKDEQCKLTDGELTNKNVRPESVEFTNAPGYTGHPWIAMIVMMAEDH